MALKGLKRNFKPLELLTEEQVEAVHKGTLEVLWVTGVRVEHERALKLCEKNGCKVDYEAKRVRMPPDVVEDCIRKAPGSFHTRARDNRNDLMIGGNTFYLGEAPGQKTIDLKTWEPKTPTRKENYDSVKVSDSLTHHHFFDSYSPFYGFEGVPTCMAMPESLAARIRNSTKCQWVGCSNDSEIFALKMAEAVGIDIVLNFCYAPPLTVYEESIEGAFRFAEAGQPIRVISGQVMGGTAPATIAGGTVINNAEVLSGVVLVQFMKSGLGVIVKDFSNPLNMQTGSPDFGNIGTCLHNAITNQIFRKYGIPIDNATCYPNSKIPDYQCGCEKALRVMIAGLTGASTLLTFGSVYGELSSHPVQAILDDDLAGMVERFLEGATISNETLAVDLINEVGPIPGYFLNKAHTREWWKLEQFVPRAADRLTYPEWMDSGKKGCLDYARERMEEILETYKPIPLTSSQEQDIERILEEARQYYKKKGLISDEEMAAYRKSMKSPNYPYE